MRTEYAALLEGLPALAAQFGCTIRDPRTIGAFTTAMDYVDRELDAISSTGPRQAFARHVMDVLSGDVAESAPELIELRDAIRQAGVAQWFVPLVAATLANTERMRQTQSITDYLAAVEREAQLAVEMALVCLGADSTPGLARFFRAIATPANVLDKLIDARGDQRRGEIAVRAGLRLHARLLLRLVAGIPRAMAAHPSAIRFAAWSVRWVTRMAVTDAPAPR